MNATLKHDRQIRSIGIALSVSVLAAVATMLVPAPVLESITGASGLSELVPVTAAPLGDTARALIAFGAGALTLAMMAVLLLRQKSASPGAEARYVSVAGMPEEDDSFAVLFKDRLSRLRMPKMPWVKDEHDITDLADLPKLRGSDIHPDAPPRRPLLATQDLPVLDLIEPVSEAEPGAIIAVPAVFPAAASIPNPVTVEEQPSLAEMVAQLEASVAQRQQQLADLEVVAANLVASKVAKAPVADKADQVEPLSLVVDAELLRSEWPPLEAVPASENKPDDMDEALAAALATLHRMSATNR